MFVFFLAQQPSVSEDINFGMMMIRMLIFLAIILVLIYFVLRKGLPLLTGAAPFRNRTVKIVERVPLDQKRSLLVVEVQEKAYLLGVAEGQINVLMELDREKLPAQAAPGPQRSVSFEQILKRTFHRRPSSQSPE